MDINFCKSVLPIPQYANTSWFTSILMCFLQEIYHLLIMNCKNYFNIQ
jgi:hypothetical protein